MSTDPEHASENLISSDADQYAPAEVGEIDFYQKREKIYTRKIEGFFQRIRMFTGWPLLSAYFLCPWLTWGDRQMVLFDLPERKFHVVFMTFWPQDFSMLAWVLAICAFGLFLFTALFGRIWCGYSCPQTVWTSIFMWIEQKTEGSRNQRIKLDTAPWTPIKIMKKSLKHTMWFGFAFLTGFTFIGYFTPIHELGYSFFTAEVGQTELFWIMLFSVLTYLNAGWMREQVCMYMCPYARFQSAMFDHDTLIVSYNKERGEPRGSRKKDANHKNDGLGDCIDCQLCVQVCPTGIDIRDGLQYQCIGCALCVDACNSVMAKMNYPGKLISYTTENRQAGHTTHLLRPRVIGYSLAIAAMTLLLAYQLFDRKPLELDIIRDRGQLYTINNAGLIENSYTLKLMNMDDYDHEFVISVSGIAGLKINGADTFNVAGGEAETIPLRLVLDNPDKQLSQDIYFSAQSMDNNKVIVKEKSRFITPAN